MQSGEVVQQFDVHVAHFAGQGEHPEILLGADRITGLDWSPDGNWIAASQSLSLFAQIWDVQTGRLISTFPTQSELVDGQSGAADIRWSPDSTRLAVGSLGAASVIDPLTGERITLWPHNTIDVAWSSDGTKIASGGGLENILWVWDTESGEELFSLEGHTALSTLDWSPDGTKIASGDAMEDNVRIWDASTGNLLMLIDEQSERINDVTWHSDSTQLAVGTNDGTIHIWDTTSGELVHAFETERQVYEVEWSPDGTQLTYAGGTLEAGDNPIPILEFPTANAG